MLVRDIERYLRETGLSATRFGREASRDPQLVFDLRRGRQPGSRVEARVRSYMERRP
jgi:hypothetical protein